MGRTMPTECEHGNTIDWGDFGDPISRVCEQCMGPPHPLVAAFRVMDEAVDFADERDIGDTEYEGLATALCGLRSAILATLHPEWKS